MFKKENTVIITQPAQQFNGDNSITNENVELIDKVYKNRWLMLFLFTSFCFINTSQVGEYAIISNILTRFYNVSTVTITYTETIYNMSGVIFFIPASFLLKSLGLKSSVLIAIGVTTIGSWIKLFAVYLDCIYIIFVGQLLGGIGQIYVLALPSQIALNWFPIKSNNLATSISFLGANLGIGVLLCVVPVIVQNDPFALKVRNELLTLHLGVAVFCTALLLMITIFFEEQPPTPPSQSRINQIKAKETFSVKYYWQSVRKCLTNKWYILLTISVGFEMAGAANLTYLLNPIVLSHFKNVEQVIGFISLIMNITGALLGIFCCKLMDVTTEIKTIHVSLNFISWMTYILFVVSLYYNNLWTLWITTLAAGTFLNSTITSAFVFCAEIMYPEIEISSNLLAMIINLFITIVVSTGSILFREFGDLSMNLFILACLTISFLLACMIPDFCKRQKGQIHD